jgi:hypothetical protein
MGLTRSEQRIVESAHDRLGLSYAEIADVLGADESSLHRWRKGGRGPAGIFSRQIAALGRCLNQMDGTFRDDGELRTWIARSSAALDGASPKATLMAGEIDRVALAIRAERAPLRDNDARISKAEPEGDK